MVNSQATSIVMELKAFGAELARESALKVEPVFASEPEANSYCVHNPNAFFLGVIFDQGVPAERAWAAPYHLYRRLGHLDPSRIGSMPFTELSAIFAQKPALHRYTNNMARYIQDSCRLLEMKYSGDASNIWSDNPTAKELESKLMDFKGIGQKKAAMAVGILARTFQVSVRDKSGIDVAYDVHIRRVFTRTGLSEADDMKSVIEAARIYSPDFPGALDLPAWHIGRTWCHSRNPNCRRCRLTKVCQRIVDGNSLLEQLEFPL